METYEPRMMKKLKKKHHIKLIAFFGFLVVLCFVLYTTFYGDFSFTGSAIGVADEIEGIQLSADLTIPSMNLNGNFPEVVLSGSSGSYFFIGNQKFFLGDLKNNYIVLKNFDGKISFDSANIFLLKGKVTEVSVNGISMMPKSKSIVKVSLDEDFNYDSLKIEDGVFIKELVYLSSGVLKVNEGKKIFNIVDEEVSIKGFSGSLEVQRGDFLLDGFLRELKILGDSEIVISV